MYVCIYIYIITLHIYIYSLHTYHIIYWILYASNWLISCQITSSSRCNVLELLPRGDPGSSPHGMYWLYPILFMACHGMSWPGWAPYGHHTGHRSNNNADRTTAGALAICLPAASYEAMLPMGPPFKAPDSAVESIQYISHTQQSIHHIKVSKNMWISPVIIHF